MLWNYPEERYYDRWYTEPPEAQLTDAEIKSRLVERLRVNPATKDETLRVDVKMGVVILNGTVSTTLAKRAAGDDAWDTPSVTDVSNQIMVDGVEDGFGGIDIRDDTSKLIVADVMTPNPLSIDGRLPVTEAAQTMRDHDVGAVIVTFDGRLKGILTDRDIIVRLVADGLDPAETPAAEATSEHVHMVNVTDPARYAAQLMRSAAVRRLPVVDGEGRIVGIVSLGDLALALDRGSALAEISSTAPNT
jgi:CBS domain-containing protein